MIDRSSVSRAALFKRLVLILAALQVLALMAFIQFLGEDGKSRAASVLWLLAGAWAPCLWAAVQRRRARIGLGLADPHRLKDALEVIATATLAPAATVLAYLSSVAGAME